MTPCLPRFRRWLKRRLRRVDRESYLCYLLFLASFAADFSLLLLLFPLSMLLYSLVSIKPSKAYWQVRQGRVGQHLGGAAGVGGEAAVACGLQNCRRAG